MTHHLQWLLLTMSKMVQKETVRCKWVLTVTELFNIAVNYIDAAGCSL